LQDTSETFVTLKTDVCNMRFQAQYLLVAYEMEARRCVEFTGGGRTVTTIDQIDSVYHEAGGDPFMAVGILGSTQDMQPPVALQSAPQSPPPPDLSTRSGSGGRSNEAEWGGGAQRVMRTSGASGLVRPNGPTPESNHHKKNKNTQSSI
jgi:hypothetical protein